jgi:O-antigen/teichoic acid export membrane protein
MTHTNGDSETEKERLERNFADLLQELRVAQTGVQILFAFLLTLPFAARFGEIDGFDKIVYLVALVAATGAAAMIISPVAYHRVLFRRGRKADLVKSAHRMASGGLALLVVAMVGAILLAADVVIGRVAAAIIAAVAAATFGLLWGLLPWRARRGEPADQDDLP